MKNRDQPDRLQSVIQKILHYLAAHPDAKDTADGITRWWVGETLAMESVQEALDHLVLQGLMTKREGPSLKAVYGLNKKGVWKRG